MARKRDSKLPPTIPGILSSAVHLHITSGKKCKVSLFPFGGKRHTRRKEKRTEHLSSRIFSFSHFLPQGTTAAAAAAAAASFAAEVEKGANG